ncbi:hypothetical protein ONZ45_g3992 [Pleurotus djamor]|nr:hypothetical protein ONZ45_g3992 [Pleurotus djamor]
MLGVAFLALAVTSVLARRNDWAAPCFEGECGYDLPPGGASGHIRMAGSPNALTDITPAAGWVILECDPNALAQDIRLVCNSHDAEAAGCAHFFSGDGPVHKYVRLPESCSPIAFARIAKMWTHEDQSIPHHRHSEIERRDGVFPQVFAISIDDKFEEIDSDIYGPVTFAVAGTTYPGLDMSFDMPHDIATKAGGDAFVENALQLMNHGILTDPTFKENSTSKLVNLDYSKEIPFTGANMACKWGAASASATVSSTLSTKVKGHLTIGVAATGDAAKKSLLSFGGRVAEFSITIDQHLSATLELKGEVKLGDFPIIKAIGLPAFSIDLHVLKVGPMFELNGHFSGQFNVAFKLDAVISYGLEKSTFEFPKTAKINPFAKDGSFELKANPGQDGSADIKVGIIPKLKFGIEVFGIKPDIYASFGGYIEGALKPQKPVPITDKKFDEKALVYCGEIFGLLAARVGAELAFFSFYKPKAESTLWDKRFDFWKSKSCAKVKRSLALPASPSNTTSAVLYTRNDKVSIPPLSSKWSCDAKVDCTVLTTIQERYKLAKDFLGL